MTTQATDSHEKTLKKRWFIHDRVVHALRDSFRTHHIEASEVQIEQVAKDIVEDWDRFLD